LRRKKVLVGNQWLSAEPNEIDISIGFLSDRNLLKMEQNLEVNKKYCLCVLNENQDGVN